MLTVKVKWRKEYTQRRHVSSPGTEIRINGVREAPSKTRKLPIIHDWKSLHLKNKSFQPRNAQNNKKTLRILYYKTRREKQPRMTRMTYSPWTQFTGKYNNNICTRKHVKNTSHTIYSSKYNAFLLENGGSL